MLANDVPFPIIGFGLLGPLDMVRFSRCLVWFIKHLVFGMRTDSNTCKIQCASTREMLRLRFFEVRVYFCSALAHVLTYLCDCASENAFVRADTFGLAKVIHHARSNSSLHRYGNGSKCNILVETLVLCWSRGPLQQAGNMPGRRSIGAICLWRYGGIRKGNSAWCVRHSRKIAHHILNVQASLTPFVKCCVVRARDVF